MSHRRSTRFLAGWTSNLSDPGLVHLTGHEEAGRRKHSATTGTANSIVGLDPCHLNGRGQHLD